MDRALAPIFDLSEIPGDAKKNPGDESKQTRKQGGKRRFQPQNSLPQVNHRTATRLEFFDFKGNEAPFGPDHQGDGSGHGPGTLGFGFGVSDQPLASCDQPGQFVFDEGFEAGSQLHVRDHGVLCLLEPQDQRLDEFTFSQHLAVPKAALDPLRLNQEDLLDSHRRRRDQQAFENQGSRQCQDQNDWKWRRRIAIERHLHLESSRTDLHDGPASDPAARDTDAQFIPGDRMVDRLDVLAAPPHESHLPSRAIRSARGKIVLEHENQVHRNVQSVMHETLTACNQTRR